MPPCASTSKALIQAYEVLYMRAHIHNSVRLVVVGYPEVVAVVVAVTGT